MEHERLMALLGKVVDDLGGANSVPLVRIGERLGLCRALDEGPATSAELARRTHCAERYVREWLANRAGSGCVAHDPDEGVFSLTPEQAAVFARGDGPVYLIGAFDTAVGITENQAKVQEAFRTGEGVGWGDHSASLAGVIAEGGFRSVRRAAETPFDMVLEAAA
jgi:hypothetical protein